MAQSASENLKSDFSHSTIYKEKFKFVRTSKFLANFSEGKADFFCKFDWGGGGLASLRNREGRGVHECEIGRGGGRQK